MESNFSVKRREFLATTAMAAAALCLPRVSLASGKAVRTPVIDMHVHCFAGLNDKRFPYHPQGTYKPEGIATPEQLLTCMNGAGVDHAVIVSPEPYQDDHRYLEYCLDAGRGRLKGTILCFADREASMSQLPRLARRGDIIAVRIHAYLPDRLPAFDKPGLKQLWTLAADNGLAVQLHFEPRYAAGFEPLIKAFPGTPVIIDHLGRPLQARNAEEYALVARWGDLPNTIIKLSSLGDPVAAAQIRPFVNQMITAYGLERMIYGGGFDSKATPASYRAARAYASSFLDKFSIADKDSVLGGNAARLLCRGW